MGLSNAQLQPADPLLTEHARRRGSRKGIADIVAPRLNVADEGGQIAVWDDSHLIIPDDMQRAVNAEASRAADPIPTYMDYQCHAYARKILLGARELKKAGGRGGLGFDRLQMAKTNKPVDQIHLHREFDLATKLTTLANYSSGYSTTLGADARFSQDGSAPITAIKTGQIAMMSGSVKPTHFIIDDVGWAHLQTHSDLLDITKRTKNDKFSKEDFKDLFDLEVLIGRMYYNNSGTMTSVWGDNAIIAHIGEDLDPDDAQSDMTLARTLVFEDFSVVTYDAPERDHRGAEWIEAEMNYAHAFIGVDTAAAGDTIAAYLIKNTY